MEEHTRGQAKGAVTISDATSWLQQLMNILGEVKAPNVTSPAFWTALGTNIAALAFSFLAFAGVGVTGGNPWVQIAEALGGLVAATIAAGVLHVHVSQNRVRRERLAATVLALHPATDTSPPSVFR